MTTVASFNTYWLLDASALTPSEANSLHQVPQIRWLYDHLQDQQAANVGPVLVASDMQGDQLAEQLLADETRTWAVTRLQTQADFAALERHLGSLRYLHTQDGQRYYLRYADSRCLAALWDVLTTSQRRALLGPIQYWHYTDRLAQHQSIALEDEAPISSSNKLAVQFRLNDEQLGGLLERTWPDQLLYSVSEQQPEIGLGLTSWQRYSCAKRVCDWLLAKREDRYPVQLEMLTHSLANMQSDWDEAKWFDALKLSYQVCVAALPDAPLMNRK